MVSKIFGLRKYLVYASLALGLVYGLLTRLIFGLSEPGKLFEVMSISFIFVVPVIAGFITIFTWPINKRLPFIYWIVYPWITGILIIFSALALAWEGLICAIIWVPIFMVMASLGGVIAGLVNRWRLKSRSKVMVLTGFAILPFILSPIEQYLFPKPKINIVTTHIAINADAETIWKNIKEVPRIKPNEQPFSISQTIGFPKPIEAKLIGTGIGAIRHATFKGKVLFIETITNWEPLKCISFTIKPSPNIPPTTFDEHVVVGGAYFDVLTGTYQIKKLGDRKFQLYLTSKNKLSTRFNWYTELWTNFFMKDIQDNILMVIKRRCESSSGTI